MKTRFLISTAVGVIFATAALAQSPSSTTTAPSNTQTPPASTSTTPKAPETTSQAPSTTTAPSTSTTAPQAQTTAPASPGGTSSTSSQPAQAQTSTPAPANDQAQQAPAGGTANTTAQQPAQPSTPANNTVQSPSTNVNASININDQQRTRVSAAITKLNVQPINNVNFSLTVGTAIPRDVRLQTLPTDVVEVVPQYRGYSFFVVRDEIVIVEPSTSKIVTVLPRSGGSTAAAPAPARSKVSFTDKDRDVVRKHVKTRTTERQTTGSAAKVVIRRGERLPDSVEFEEFPDTVYRDAPSLREYRYIHRENRTYLVDPGEHRVIEEID
ncbi:MAG: DUF1236 domain-containing protein [Bradyrhizobium sp.]|nr:DUF1236 domain-containing protein [Bradyrhizobium sp.]